MESARDFVDSQANILKPMKQVFDNLFDSETRYVMGCVLFEFGPLQVRLCMTQAAELMCDKVLPFQDISDASQLNDMATVGTQRLTWTFDQGSRLPGIWQA
jgi:hypothetical protein